MRKPHAVSDWTIVEGKQALIDKMTHEMAVLKRLKFAARSEHYSAAAQPSGRNDRHRHCGP